MQASTSPPPISGAVRTVVETGVALTFDDGPDPVHTPGILERLAEADVTATFFLVGEMAERHPDVVRRIVGGGHQIGSHGWQHVRHSGLSRREIDQSLERTTEVLRRFDAPIDLFRPPYGDHDQRVVDAADRLDQTLWLWTVDAEDWEQPGSDEIVRRIHHSVKDGSVVLLHDGRGDRTATVEAVPGVVAAIRRMGFTFVSLDQSA